MAVKTLSSAAAVAFLLVPLLTWFASVNGALKGSYLDEEFHIRQARQYCQGKFHIWDPKITTPPGLYVLSYVSSYIWGCNDIALRAINAICLVALLFVLRETYIQRRRLNKETGYLSALLALHSCLNIVLFPPLFFFSALYYTDVPSTLSVMVFYWVYLTQVTEQPTLRSTALQVLLGTISLTFRQTNIFWVAVMPAALTLIICLDQGHKVVKVSMYQRADGFGDTTWSVAKTSWKMNVIYDPPVRDAFIEDYFRTAVSIVVGGLKTLTEPKRIVHILRYLAPYLITLILFGGFIGWNGGVVLGDKSNHVATIHLAQMLYLWPFITFFSWPFLAGHFALYPVILASRLSKLAGFEALLHFRRRVFLPRHRLLVGFTALALLIIRFNTIVHPFTLADNRHFNFYIFRRLLHPWWIRFAVAPIYIVSAWACLDTRGEQPAAAPSHISAGVVRSDQKLGDQVADTLRANAAPDASTRPTNFPDGRSSPLVSFTLVFLLVTALSLCTAPLVEPRYCILPYVIWRLHLPLAAPDDRLERRLRAARSVRGVVGQYDWRVFVETGWALLVNAVTGYIFLNWTFTWPSEPRSTQRFMW